MPASPRSETATISAPRSIGRLASCRSPGEARCWRRIRQPTCCAITLRKASGSSMSESVNSGGVAVRVGVRRSVRSAGHTRGTGIKPAVALVVGRRRCGRAGGDPARPCGSAVAEMTPNPWRVGLRQPHPHHRRQTRHWAWIPLRRLRPRSRHPRRHHQHRPGYRRHRRAGLLDSKRFRAGPASLSTMASVLDGAHLSQSVAMANGSLPTTTPARPTCESRCVAIRDVGRPRAQSSTQEA